MTICRSFWKNICHKPTFIFTVFLISKAKIQWNRYTSHFWTPCWLCMSCMYTFFVHLMCILGSGLPTDIYPATVHTLCIFRSSIASFFLSFFFFPLGLPQKGYQKKKLSIKIIALSSSSPLGRELSPSGLSREPMYYTGPLPKVI